MCKCDKPRQVDVVAKCSDLFSFYNVKSGESYDGYVPTEIGIGGGDYVEFTYCLGCGHITGTWPRPTGVEDDTNNG